MLDFNIKWINWIKVYLSSATILVLVNGSPTKKFKLRRGLRQDHPLAPFFVYHGHGRIDWFGEGNF